ncbi:glycosyltransferase family 4 protein [Falsiroseomonas oryziterrae]|uniref:glycosyltransferase family 4 protein n=1 Tax=Falsiroseomonas oryziterrae TaxID=2911368 RepID=UPI001F3DD011|nr:glycosyltransferase family 4 protein [Roseomonas sp. NPKOSM-4]
MTDPATPAVAPRRKLRALFVHQNFPGQYAHLAPALAQHPDVEVWGAGEKEGYAVPGIRYVAYGAPRGPGEHTHRYIRGLEAHIRRGQLLANRLVQLRDSEGFRPDVIVCHPGWGEGLYLKDVLPQARTLYYWEFYYNAFGQDLGFDPSRAVSLDDAARARTLNATQLIALQTADWGVSPTRWQKSRYPDWAQRRITVLHEGVDTTRCAPRADAVFRTPEGREFRRGDPVISYVARNLEPYRGFPSFMRALALLQAERPDLHAVVVGGNEVSYGSKPEGAESWKERMLGDLAGRLDLSRIHFTGRVAYDALHDLFRVTRAHLYLTYPFVLSWSMLEAMACGALVIGSATPPVEEVIEHGVNGLLVPFFEPERIAEAVLRVLADEAGHAHLAEAGRRSVVERYDLRQVCLPRQLALVQHLAAGRLPTTADGDADA